MSDSRYSIVVGMGSVAASRVAGGLDVEVRGCGWAMTAYVPDGDRAGVAGSLRRAEGFSLAKDPPDIPSSSTVTLWGPPNSGRPGWLTLAAATQMTYADGQYPHIDIGPAVAARVALLIEMGPEGMHERARQGDDGLFGARRRTDDNLRRVFG